MIASLAFEPGKARVESNSFFGTCSGSKSHCPSLMASKTEFGTTNSLLRLVLAESRLPSVPTDSAQVRMRRPNHG